MFSIQNGAGEWLGWQGHRHDRLYAEIFKPAETGPSKAHRFPTHLAASRAVIRLRTLGYTGCARIVPAPEFAKPTPREVASAFIDD